MKTGEMPGAQCLIPRPARLVELIGYLFTKSGGGSGVDVAA
jgi:hypothetical protein